MKSKSTCFSTVKTQRWKISKLRPHPRQAECFSNLSDVELKELAASMRRWGLLQPIHILPDGTIIGGHQRYLAALLLGWIEIDVFVRYDLVAQGEAAIMNFLDSSD